MAICQNTATNIPHYDLQFYVGDDDKLIMYWCTEHEDPDTGLVTRTPVDLTGYTVEMHFRNDYTGGLVITTEDVERRVVYRGDPVVHNGVPVFNSTVEVDVEEQTPPVHTEIGIIDVPTTGRIEFILTSAELRLLFGDAYARKTYIYDVQVKNADSKNRTLMLGNVELTNDVTRSP